MVVKKKGKLTGLVASLLVPKLNQDFLDKFVGGEVRTRKGKEYLFQGGIRHIRLESGNPQLILVVVGWLAQRVRPVFSQGKGPLGKLDNSGWLLHPCGSGYEVPIDIAKIGIIKNSREKVLVVLGFDGERTRLIPPGDPLCVAKSIGIVGVQISDTAIKAGESAEKGK